MPGNNRKNPVETGKTQTWVFPGSSGFFRVLPGFSGFFRVCRKNMSPQSAARSKFFCVLARTSLLPGHLGQGKLINVRLGNLCVEHLVNLSRPGISNCSALELARPYSLGLSFARWARRASSIATPCLGSVTGSAGGSVDVDPASVIEGSGAVE